MKKKVLHHELMLTLVFAFLAIILFSSVIYFFYSAPVGEAIRFSKNPHGCRDSDGQGVDLYARNYVRYNSRNYDDQCKSATVLQEATCVHSKAAYADYVCPKGTTCNSGVCKTMIIPLPVCGNSKLEPPNEMCDDGNTRNDDACLGNCQGLAYCGDGYIFRGVEFCDDQNNDPYDGCVNCQEPRCGDGYVQTGVDYMPNGIEECDDGNSNQFDSCVSCRFARCGDGIVFGPPNGGQEQCDDGNINSNDGCSASCQPEACAETDRTNPTPSGGWGGLDPLISGTTTIGTAAWNDICLDNTTLIEYYCSGNYPGVWNMTINCNGFDSSSSSFTGLSQFSSAPGIKTTRCSSNACV